MARKLTVQDVAPAAALVLWAVVGPLVASPRGFDPNVRTFVIGVAVTAPFAVRRHAPLVVGVLMMSGFALLAGLEAWPDGLGIGETGLVLGAYTIEAHRRGRPPLPVVAPIVGAILLVVADRASKAEIGFFVQYGPITLVYFGALIAAGAAAGAAFRDRTSAMGALRAHVAELRRTAPAAAVARIEAERRAMAAEIERVVHGLVRAIRPAVADARTKEHLRVEHGLNEVATRSRDALAELHTMLRALRPGDEGTEPRPSRPSTAVAVDVERVATEPRPPPPAVSGHAALWLPVLLLIGAGVAERLVLPPLPIHVSPTITIEAPEFGEAGAYAATVISALVFLLRERAPAAMSVLVGSLVVARSAEGSLFGLQPTRDLLVAAAAFFVALHTRRLVVAAALAAPAVAGWAIGRTFDPVPIHAPEAITLVALVTAGFLAGRSLRRPLQRAAALADERDELRRELADLEARMRGHERTVLARELHDIVGHGLTLIAVQAGAATVRLAAGDDARETVDAIERDLAGVLADLDRLRVVLGVDGARAGADDHSWPARLVARAAAGGARVDADIRLNLQWLAPGLQTIIRRILEEAVTNAHKHGDGQSILLRATEVGSDVQIVVENSVGERLAPPDLTGSGMGVRGMQERARLYGGELTVTPGDMRWRVDALIPVRAEALAQPVR